VSTIDIAPTVLDYAVDFDEVDMFPSFHTDGRSWRHDIHTGVYDNSRCLFFEFEYDRAVRCGCDKYLKIYEQNATTSNTYKIGLLYDYSVESTNLADLCGGTDAYITNSSDNQEYKDLNILNQYPLKETMGDVLQCHLDRTSALASSNNMTSCEVKQFDPCVDSPFITPGGSCDIVSSNMEYCSIGAESHCPKTCDTCSSYECLDSEVPFVYEGITYNCRVVSRLPQSDIDTYCDEVDGLAETCRGTCGLCGSSSVTSDLPSDLLSIYPSFVPSLITTPTLTSE